MGMHKKTAPQAKLAQIKRRISEIAEDIAAQRQYIEKSKAEGFGVADGRLTLTLLELQLQQEMKERDKLAAELGE